MLRILKNRKAQSILGEYAIVFAVALAMIVTMSVYFQRGVQGRIRDARMAMGNIVLSRTHDYHSEVRIDYEPYYLEVNSDIASDLYEKKTLGAGGLSGNATKSFLDLTTVETQSITAAPKDAD